MEGDKGPAGMSWQACTQQINGKKKQRLSRQESKEWEGFKEPTIQTPAGPGAEPKVQFLFTKYLPFFTEHEISLSVLGTNFQRMALTTHPFFPLLFSLSV